MAQKKITQTAGHDALGDFAPEFAHLNDDILFGEVWSRNDLLSLRDRSIVTLTALISQGITDSSLTYHLRTAKSNGVSRTEIAEIITHIAFYAGWPKAWAAFRQAKEVWNEPKETSHESHHGLLFPIGQPNDAYAKYFTGQSYLANIVTEGTNVNNVTFEPGCRNFWHIHHNMRQILLCVGGEGWYQEENQPARHLKAGDAVVIPAGVKHWHGATEDSWFQHLVLHAPIDEKEDTYTTWCEEVTEKEYKALSDKQQ